MISSPFVRPTRPSSTIVCRCGWSLEKHDSSVWVKRQYILDPNMLNSALKVSHKLLNLWEASWVRLKSGSRKLAVAHGEH